jgi:hypothetical protein
MSKDLVHLNSEVRLPHAYSSTSSQSFCHISHLHPRRNCPTSVDRAGFESEALYVRLFLAAPPLVTVGSKLGRDPGKSTKALSFGRLLFCLRLEVTDLLRLYCALQVTASVHSGLSSRNDLLD